MQRKTKQAISYILTLILVLGMFATVPMTVSATGQDEVTIVVDTLTTSTSNSTSAAESQWSYNDTTKILTLTSLDGEYVLKGSNADLRVVVSSAAVGASITLGEGGTGVALTSTRGSVFSALANCTVTLDEDNTFTAADNVNTGSAFQVGDATRVVKCTIDGSESLVAAATGKQSGGIFIGSNCELTINGTAEVNASSTSQSGIKMNSSGVINVGADAELTATGGSDGSGISLLGAGTLNVDGTITTTGASGRTGISASGILTLDGIGIVEAVGGALNPAINTPASVNILMGEDVTLSMDNKSNYAETHTFQKLSKVNTHQWKLTTAEIVAPGRVTDASINVTLTKTAIGEVAREIRPETKHVTFTAIQVGGTSGTTFSTGIAITFSTSVAILSASDITIENATGAAVRGTAFAGSNTKWAIGLESVSTQGAVKVSVETFNTFIVDNGPVAVEVYKGSPREVTFAAMQLGGTIDIADTTGIGITFGAVVTGLTAKDITISGAGVGPGKVVKGSLTGSGKSYTLAINSVASQGAVTVSIASFNYNNYTVLTPQAVDVYKNITGPPTTVTIAAIPGVTIPKRNETPVTAITATKQYTGTVTWSPNDNPFKASTIYTATITLTAKPGYTLTGVPANFFTVAGATATNVTNSGVVKAVFPRTTSGGDPGGGGGGGGGTISKPPATTSAAVDDAKVAGTGPFTDVPADSWYSKAVLYLFEKGLMIGTSDTTFSPSTELSRAMIVTILYRIAGEPSVEGLEHSFNDVPEGQWYSNAIKWAAENGVTKGYGDGRFGTNDPVTKEQLAAFIHRAQQADDKSPPNKEGAAIPDADMISLWAKDVVNELNDQGIFDDIPGESFNPKNPATRAEVASVLFKWLSAVLS